jgi:pilus assembly protein CpaE
MINQATNQATSQEIETGLQPKSGGADGAKPKRAKFVGFVSDAASAAALHKVFDPVFPHGGGFHVVSFRTSLAILGRMVSPEILLIDLSGEVQPLNALMDLAEVVEPGTTVLAIGESRELSFYRAIVNGMGIKEYVAKPLAERAIEQHLLPLVRARDGGDPKRGGRLVAVSGVRGGCGSSTIAANLAWVIGHDTHRHAVLLDADLHTGTAAMTLNVDMAKGLTTALEMPERIDDMLIERLAQPVTDRVHLIAGREPVQRDIEYSPGSCGQLIQALRKRYKYVIADAGAKPRPFARDLIYMAHQRVMVLDPTILSIRNLERLNAVPGNDSQSPRTILVLNQAGRPGGLNLAYMEQTLGLKFDAVIPDLPRVIPKTEKYGDIAAGIRGPFRNAMLKLAKALGAEAATANEAAERTTESMAA